ncbi:hypothetical protein LEP1GSC187_0935 [Leptospira santarosai str. ZUN179]|uniref:Uncharacterized protein n=2 Tax=Leptospira santarosai TaxID=28183 RepID=M6VA30_9LEPT|nr:hypothetical protein LEP1GSC179_3901 [Leptospira santarosai str. MOR084]EMO46378.1 hypothetical protein LEP1GSC187_0935 [Leptospira santarosai str. ZUN179]EMO85864.1 hypothetical protein LEP1GSC070_0328 [Leptospira santarosai str. AIM]
MFALIRVFYRWNIHAKNQKLIRRSSILFGCVKTNPTLRLLSAIGESTS